MNDSFIDNLKGEWQTIETGPAVDFGKLQRKLVRRRYFSILLKSLEFVSTILAVAAGVILAMTIGGWLGWASAFMLVFILSALFIWSYKVWRTSLHWDDRGPEGTVAFGCRNIESSLKTVRIMRVHCWFLLAFVAVLWGLQFAGQLRMIDFLIMFTAVSVLVVAVLWVYLNRRQARLESELDRFRTLLEELRDQ